MSTQMCPRCGTTNPNTAVTCQNKACGQLLNNTDVPPNHPFDRNTQKSSLAGKATGGDQSSPETPREPPSRVRFSSTSRPNIWRRRIGWVTTLAILVGLPVAYGMGYAHAQDAGETYENHKTRNPANGLNSFLKYWLHLYNNV